DVQPEVFGDDFGRVVAAAKGYHATGEGAGAAQVEIVDRRLVRRAVNIRPRIPHLRHDVGAVFERTAFHLRDLHLYTDRRVVVLPYDGRRIEVGHVFGELGQQAIAVHGGQLSPLARRRRIGYAGLDPADRALGVDLAGRLGRVEVSGESDVPDIVQQPPLHHLLQVRDHVLGGLDAEHPDEGRRHAGVLALGPEVRLALEREVAKEERTLFPFPVARGVQAEL